MKGYFTIVVIVITLFSGCALTGSTKVVGAEGVFIELPAPRLISDVSVEQALKRRHSVRKFQQQSLSLAEVSQLLWAAQGVTTYRSRTAPSAGGLYPLEVYLVVGNVDGMVAGVYRYVPENHAVQQTVEGDVRKSLSNAAYWQEWVGAGAVVLVFTGIYQRTTKKYGERGQRYVHMEAGHAAQNVYLQAHALGLGTVVVGAFMDSWVKSLLHMKDDEQPLSIMPVGRM